MCKTTEGDRWSLRNFWGIIEVPRLEKDAQYIFLPQEGPWMTELGAVFPFALPDDDPELPSWKLACEYFMTKTAERSGIAFDEALCQLCEGAHKYETKILRLHP